MRDDSDIGFLTAIVRKAVIAQSIVKPAEQHDIMLQSDVRATPAAATSAPEASAAAPSTTAETTTAVECGRSVSSPGEPRPSSAVAHAGGRSDITGS